MNGNPNNQDVDMWNMLTYNKISSTSTIIVSAHITMHHDYSYPYYGTFCKATWNSGAGVYRNRSGSDSNTGGDFLYGNYFSGEDVSLIVAGSYALSKNLSKHNDVGD